MKTNRFLIAAIGAVLALSVLVGCSKPATPPPAPQPSAEQPKPPQPEEKKEPQAPAPPKENTANGDGSQGTPVVRKYKRPEPKLKNYPNAPDDVVDVWLELYKQAPVQMNGMAKFWVDTEEAQKMAAEQVRTYLQERLVGMDNPPTFEHPTYTVQRQTDSEAEVIADYSWEASNPKFNFKARFDVQQLFVLTKDPTDGRWYIASTNRLKHDIKKLQ